MRASLLDVLYFELFYCYFNYLHIVFVSYLISDKFKMADAADDATAT